MGPKMRYLGLTLDPKWKFRVHFTKLAPRWKGMAASLGCLQPNHEGPSARVRCLFHGVVRSVAFHGAPT